MISRTGSLALVLGLLAAAAPSFAYDVQSEPTPSRPCATGACDSDSVQPPAREGMPSRTLAAQVISIDESAGRVRLRTELGIVTVPASPATIGQLSVGDVVMLRVVPDSDDSPSASPPGEDDSDDSSQL